MLLDASLTRKINAGVAPPMAGGMCQVGAPKRHVAPASLGPCPHTRGDVGKAGGFPETANIPSAGGRSKARGTSTPGKAGARFK